MIPSVARRLRILFPVLFVTLLFGVLLPGCASGRGDIPTAIDGSIDLRGVDLSETVPLSGEWLFYPDALLTPDSVDSRTQSAYGLAVPSTWRGQVAGDRALPGRGYGTYQLDIHVDRDVGTLEIVGTEISTAFRLYANGELVAEGGRVAASEGTSRPAWTRMSASVTPDAGRVTLLLQVSNFHHARGGILGKISAGSEPVAAPAASRELAWFIFGGLLLIGVYHVGLYAFGSVDRAKLWFGLATLLMAVRTLLTTPAYLFEPSTVFAFELLMTAEYLALFVGPALFLYYGCSIFSGESRIRVAHAVALLSGTFALVTLATPARVFTGLLYFYHPIPIFVGVYLIVVGVNAARRGRLGARVFLGGMLVLLATVVHDILFSLSVVSTGYISNVGLFIFLFVQLFLLSKQFSENHRQTELLVEEKQRLEGLSYRDALTGIGNRRHFDTYLGKECSRAERIGSPISLVLIDIDHFKHFNDTFGHQLGDEVLIRVAGRIAQALRRPGDQCARQGGEEFAIILPDTSAEGVRLVAQRLRVDIAKMQPPEPHALGSSQPVMQAIPQITASLGVATMYWGLENSPDATDAPRQLIEMADRALYLAKERGRNRVVVDRM